MTLTWGLVVATKDRLDPLRTCVSCALSQARPPSEVVIVDASEDWDYHRSEIGALLADRPEIRFVYRRAPKPSLTVQRNCALDEATADILFMIDDDSHLFPDAAERIMAHYEADTEHTLAGIELRPAANAPDGTRAGKNAAEPGALPLFTRIRDAIRSRDGDRSVPGRARNWLAWTFDGAWRRLMMIGTDQWFIPYDGRYPKVPRVPHLMARAIQPTRLFEGYRMTFRRAAVTAERFEPLLLYYCPGEDLDLSYRVSRNGGLMRSHDAWVYHSQSASGRLKHEQVALLGTLNQALFMRRNAPDQAWARARFRRHVRHWIAVSMIRDLRSGLLDLPKTRGAWKGLRLSRRIFDATLDEIEGFYPALQERIVKGDAPL